MIYLLGITAQTVQSASVLNLHSVLLGMNSAEKWLQLGLTWERGPISCIGVFYRPVLIVLCLALGDLRKLA